MAAQYLQNQGYEIIERNFRCRDGELDLIAKDHGDWVVVEVKTRYSKKADAGFEAIDDIKLQKLRRAIRQWSTVRQIESLRIRLDAISVFVSPTSVKFEHLKQVL